MKASSTAASRRWRPRTRISAAPMPKIVFSGTATIAMTTDSHSALTAAGVVM